VTYRHVLKSWPMFFNGIMSGARTSDIRYSKDRRFVVGDVMELHEWNPVTSQYTGRVQVVEITYIQTNMSNPCAISDVALHNDYSVLSVKKLEE
jgi:uncharacterized protein YqfB (UPF0267 family)